MHSHQRGNVGVVFDNQNPLGTYHLKTFKPGAIVASIGARGYNKRLNFEGNDMP